MRNFLTAVGLATLVTAMFVSPPVAGAVIVVGTLAAALVGLRNTDDQPIVRRDRPRVGIRRAWRDAGGLRLWGRARRMDGTPDPCPRHGYRYCAQCGQWPDPPRLIRCTDCDGYISREPGLHTPKGLAATVDWCACDPPQHASLDEMGRARHWWRRKWGDIPDTYPPDPPRRVPDDDPEPDLDTPDPKDSPEPQEEPDMSSIGTGGRASIAGLVTDWETSVEAREHPETFIAWLHAQAQASRQRAQMVPDLVAQYHGRGPSGHAGVPDEQVNAFSKAYEEAASAEADAYAEWAVKYAAYVEAAEEQMTHEFGREVIGSAHAAHRG